MRNQIRHASPVARNALQILAGWAPSRSNILYAALISAAAATAVTTASAIATGSTMITTTAAETQTVSPRMAALIADYKAALEQVDELAPDASTDADAWQALEDRFVAAQAALIAERPSSIADYAAKYDALVEIEAAEGQHDVFKALSADAHALAGAR
jgi:hypothetical protein